MIRIIAVLFVILLVLILLNKLTNKRESKEKTRKLLKYCKSLGYVIVGLNSVTDDQKCINEDFDHKDLN